MVSKSNALLAGLAILLLGFGISRGFGSNRSSDLSTDTVENTPNVNLLSNLELVQEEISRRRAVITDEIQTLEQEAARARNFISGGGLGRAPRNVRKTFQAPRVGQTAARIASGQISTPLHQFSEAIQRQVFFAREAQRNAQIRRAQLPIAREQLADIEQAISLRLTELDTL